MPGVSGKLDLHVDLTIPHNSSEASLKPHANHFAPPEVKSSVNSASAILPNGRTYARKGAIKSVSQAVDTQSITE